MLKAVSSITNAIGALNYKGTWNATANTPALASGVGTKGDYYVISTAGTTTLDGISSWGIGDWAAFNGATWQRLEGGADLNGVNLDVSGTSNLKGLVEIGGNTSSSVDALYAKFKATAENGGYLEFENVFGPLVRITGTKLGGGSSADEGYFSVITAVNSVLTGGVSVSNGGTSWSAISDEKHKTIIEPITDGLRKVESLRTVIGKYKTDPDDFRRSFLIAQDVEEVLPEAITKTEKDGEVVLMLSYTDVIPLLACAVKELSAELAVVKSELAQLKGA